jgi:hypothetical protein
MMGYKQLRLFFQGGSKPPICGLAGRFAGQPKTHRAK